MLRTRIAGTAVLLLFVATLVLGWVVVIEVSNSVAARAADEIGTASVSLLAASRAQIKRIESQRSPLSYEGLGINDLPNPAGLSAQLQVWGEKVPLPAAELPAGLALAIEGSNEADGRVHRVSSSDGDRWVAVYEVEGGARLVVAVDSRFGDELVAHTLWAVVTIGSAVVVLAAATMWLTVRRSLRPLESLAEVADAIAAGDLEARAAPTDTSSEVGRVASSVNEMVDALARVVAAEETNRIRAERFAADAAHELRTPTTAILGYAQLGARQGPWSDARNAEMWESVQEQANRLRDLVEHLLEVQRLTVGDIPLPEPQRFDLAALIRSVTRDSMVVAPEHPIDVLVPDPCWVTAPRAPLQQIISNLVTNVRVHTPPSTSAVVEVVVGSGTIELVVRDDGPGIPTAARAEVFNRLVRLPGTSVPGFGLGLAIVAATVERLHGSVSIDGTTTERSGTTVRVTLPFRVSLSTDRS